VKPVWDSLESHFETWAAQPAVSKTLSKDVLSTFIKRRAKHYHTSFAAAFALDPVNFETFQDGKTVRAPLSRLSATERGDMEATVVR
jgi:hypothetical protein